MRERGLKYVSRSSVQSADAVAPHAGAWIEMVLFPRILAYSVVAPHAGAWIEMAIKRGTLNTVIVAPHAGAWIEILLIVILI